MNTDDIEILFSTTADTLVPNDQVIIEGDLFIVRTVDSDREDIDEVYVTGENLSGGDDEFALYADDEFQVWAI